MTGTGGGTVPLVSVVIPSYNDRDFVCDAVDCCLDQTYGAIEIIVVDDGSTDGTGEMLGRKYGSRITYRFQRNRGLAGARNAGIGHSNGRYIQFLDADDLIHPDKIRVQVELLGNSSRIALSYSDYLVTEMGQRAAYERMSPILNAEKPLAHLMMKWETELSIPIHCFLFDAAVFRERGIRFDEALPNHEDWECWMNILALEPEIGFVDKPFAIYRKRSGSLCKDEGKMRAGYLAAIDKQIRKHRLDREAVGMLYARRKEIRWLYRDVSPVMRTLKRLPPVVQRLYHEIVPWRIRHLLE